MTRFQSPSLAYLIPVAGLALGCGDGQLDDADNVRIWATTASALAVYSHAHGTISVADGESSYADPACPATTDDGTTLSISGGCTEAGGREWVGTARVVRNSSGDRELTLDGFGNFEASAPHATLTGSVQIRRLGAASHEFDADFVQRGGMTTTFRYSGRVDGEYTGPSLWNGSGRVEREGWVEPTGVVDAHTVDELVDDAVCSGQPASGQTTLEADGQTAVVQYDGATDCDEAQAARLSVDGEDRGQVNGISCAVAPGLASRSRAGLAGTGLLAAVALARCLRRRR